MNVMNEKEEVAQEIQQDTTEYILSMLVGIVMLLVVSQWNCSMQTQENGFVTMHQFMESHMR